MSVPCVLDALVASAPYGKALPPRSRNIMATSSTRWLTTDSFSLPSFLEPITPSLLWSRGLFSEERIL